MTEHDDQAGDHPHGGRDASAAADLFRNAGFKVREVAPRPPSPWLIEAVDARLRDLILCEHIERMNEPTRLPCLMLPSGSLSCGEHEVPREQTLVPDGEDAPYPCDRCGTVASVAACIEFLPMMIVAFRLCRVCYEMDYPSSVTVG